MVEYVLDIGLRLVQAQGANQEEVGKMEIDLPGEVNGANTVAGSGVQPHLGRSSSLPLFTLPLVQPQVSLQAGHGLASTQQSVLTSDTIQTCHPINQVLTPPTTSYGPQLPD